MSAPDLFRLYLDGVAFVIAAQAQPIYSRADLRSRVAVVLGFAHGKLLETCAEGLPLSRTALLTEVAKLCGEADADPVGDALARADERGKVLDALEARLSVTGGMSVGARADLAAFVAEQRKVVVP